MTGDIEMSCHKPEITIFKNIKSCGGYEVESPHIIGWHL